MAEAESLIKKLTKASKKIKAISKDGKNNFQGYTFQSESAIKSAVKSAIESVGISIIPSFEILNQRDVKNNKGRVAHIVDVMGSFDITDGNEHLTGTMPGSGLDSGEKATAKACTSAQKYFYKQLFNISDKDEDPDATDSNLAQPNNSQQRNRNTTRSNSYQSQPQRPASNNYQKQPQQPARQAQRPSPQQPTNSKASSEFEELVNEIAINSGSPVSKVRDAIGKTLNANKDYQSMNNADKQKKAISVAKNMLGGKQNGK